jgi:S-adenosylmethionine hydrolase
MSTIALLTDLGSGSGHGSASWFPGELKGTILSLNPRAVPIDFTHSVPHGDVASGAFALLAGYRSFPEDTVWLCSVGHGSADMRVIAAKTASHIFIAPDNGLLSWVLRREVSAEVREVNIEEYLLPSGCATFPARDLLAPLAADLSDWLEFEQCGRATSNYVKLAWPEPLLDEGAGRIAGEVVFIDVFGNAVTSVSPRELADVCGDGNAVCIVGDDRDDPIPVKSHYHDVEDGALVAYAGSAGLMEIGINGGRAKSITEIDSVGKRVVFEKG